MVDLPVGIYTRTKDHLDILTRARKSIPRKPLSEETREKISISKSNKVSCLCDYCGGERKLKTSVHERYKRHFCSRKCYSLFRSYLLPKEEQPAYGSSFTLEERQERIKARSILNHAVRNGKVTRKPCEICGEIAEGHHDNYANPLEVRWLCFTHHRKFHHEHPHLLVDKA